MSEPKRQRVNITPSPELWVILGKLCKISGKPKAGTIAEILDTVAPLFLAQAEAEQALKDARSPEAAKQVIHDHWARERANVDQQLLDLDSDGRTVKGKRKRAKGEHGNP